MAVRLGVGLLVSWILMMKLRLLDTVKWGWLRFNTTLLRSENRATISDYLKWDFRSTLRNYGKSFARVFG